MKKIQGKHGGTLYVREKGDPAPKKGKTKQVKQSQAPRKTQHKV